MVAIQEGVGVNSITLFIFGGVAHIANEPENADSDFRIVVSGPFASLTLGAGFYMLGLGATTIQPLSEISFYLAYMNFLLAVFNLIPGFPLDGGRIFRALVWKISGDYVRATQWATAGGFAIAILFASVGFFVILAGSIFAGIYLVFVGGYLGFVARDSYLQAKLTNHFQDRIVEEQRKQNNSISPQLKVSHSAFGTVFIPTGVGDSEDEICTKRGKK
jgi:Zn-dependent protease